MPSLLDWIFPPLCIRCNRQGSLICERCLHTIFWFEKNEYSVPVPQQDHYFTVTSACQFIDTAQLLVHALKYQHLWTYGEVIGQLTALGVGEKFPQNIDALVPVPLHPKRQRWRGYNQAELVARELAKRWHLPILSLLKRPHYKPPQAKKGREERLHLGSVFALDARAIALDPERKLRLCLVDDVVTTGSTLLSADRVLEAGGWKQVQAITFARTE